MLNFNIIYRIVTMCLNFKTTNWLETTMNPFSYTYNSFSLECVKNATNQLHKKINPTSNNLRLFPPHRDFSQG